MHTTYTTDDILLVRRYQAVRAACDFMEKIMKKIKYGGYTSCDLTKMTVLTQWVDMYLRYENPSNADEEDLNCLTEAKMDDVLEQISKMTGVCFVAKDTIWTDPTGADDPIPWEWNDSDDIEWNANTDIDTNG